MLSRRDDADAEKRTEVAPFILYSIYPFLLRCAAAREFDPIRCRVRWNAGAHKLEDKLDVVLKSDGDSGRWFPASFEYSRLVDGIVAETDQGTVEVVSLNKPIPREVFTFQGMGLPVGSFVSDHVRPDVAGEMAWDGKQVVSTTRAERAVASQSRTNKVYVILAAILAAVAGLLFWRFLSPRTAAK